MAGSDPKEATNQALVELGRALTGVEGTNDHAPLGTDPAGEGRAEVELALSDLIGDPNGEIVFFNDSGFRSLALTTAAAVVADGQARAHVTAAGADVTGYHFVRFDNGLTFYFQEGLDLVVQPPG